MLFLYKCNMLYYRLNIISYCCTSISKHWYIVCGYSYAEKLQEKSYARVYTVTPHEKLRKAFEDYQNGSSQRVVCAKLKYSITRSRFQNFIKEEKGEIISRLSGHPTVLSKEAECEIVEHLLTVSEWGFPFDNIDLPMTVKRLLDKEETNVYVYSRKT